MQRNSVMANQEKYFKQAIIVGAGVAGQMVCDEILTHPKINYSIAGFIDDDETKQKFEYKNFKTLGKISELDKILKKNNIEIVLIAIPSATGATIRKIINKCTKNKVEFKIVPGIFEIISGDVKINQIREVKPEDLLGRETVKLDTTALKLKFKNKSVLVTGGAGSIGSELCRQLLSLGIGKLIILDQNESELYYLQQLLDTQKISKIYGICDISNKSRLEYFFKTFRPDIIFHAAAYKHVPLMEENIYEAVRVNIFGSKNVFELSEKYNAEVCVLISSDKAVNPTSIMGATKRIAEHILQNFAAKRSCKTIFSSVRFGNVLGSRGSVVPLFKSQIENGGPITLTHPEIYRYFMTINEAVSLVLNTIKISNGGEIFALDMGEQIKISDLAKNLIALSGLKLNKDIKIVYTGLRPGEKLYEELLTANDKATATKLEKIFIAYPEKSEPEFLKSNLKSLEKLLNSTDYIQKQLRQVIINLVPEFIIE